MGLYVIIFKEVSRRLLTAAARSNPRSDYVGFMVDKILTIAILHIYLWPGTATICPLVAGVRSTLSRIQLHATN
jgi:hypothetical protein